MNKLSFTVVVLATLALAAGLSLAGPISAQGPAAGGSGAQRAELPAPTAAMREQAVEAEAARAEKLALPAAVAERRESRLAFSAFGSVQAKDLAKETFGDAVTGSQAPGPRLGKGERVDRYLGGLWAKVDPGEGKRPVLVRSVLPMLAEDASGEKAPVNLDLEETGSALSPKNPLVDVAVERDASAGVRLEDSGVGVRPLAPMAGKSELQVVAGEKAFWAAVDADTDYLVAPTPGGFESLIQVRSEEAPEQFSLAVDLPKGAELRDSADQHGIEVVDPDRSEKEQVVAQISRPMAWDADGSPVEVTYALQDSTLVLRYQHRGKDLHYPLLVDPRVDENFYDDGQPVPSPTNGWVYGFNNPALHGGLNTDYELYLFANAFTPLPAGASHGFFWTARGDAFIYRADFVFTDHVPGSSNPAVADQVLEGIFDNAHGHYEPGSVREPPSFADQGIGNPYVTAGALNNKYKKICQNWGATTGSPPVPECSPGAAVSPAGSPGNMFVLQQSWPVVTTPTVTPSVTMAGAIMWLTEFIGPTNLVASGGNLIQWDDDTDEPTQRTLQLGALDGGLGIDRFEIDAGPGRLDTNGDGMDDDALDYDALGCNGSVADGAACPTNATGQMSFNTRAAGALGSVAHLPEGITRWYGRAIDVVDNIGQTQIPVRIDRSLPSLALTGPLKTNSAGGATLPPGDQNLRIEASDGARGGTDAQQRSGIERVDVLVDGKRVGRFRRDQNEWLLSNSTSGTGAFGSDLTFPWGTDNSATPLVLDFDGDGVDTPAFVRSIPGGLEWSIRPKMTSGESPYPFLYGNVGDIPVAGDWDGDGHDGIGVFRPSNNTWYLRNDYHEGPANYTFAYGASQAPYNDLPVVGDYDGNGTDTVGVYRRQTNQFMLRNSNTTGSSDITVAFGTSASPYDDLPLIGDWNGDGVDTTGKFRRQTNEWLLRNTNTTDTGGRSFTYGTATDTNYEDVPVPGDFDNDNKDTPGVFERACVGDSCPLSRDWTYKPVDQYGDDQTVQVVAVDRVGHVSKESIAVHRGTQGTLLDPADGARTAAQLPLRAQLTGGGATTVKFQYRRPLQPWTDVPPIALTNASTGSPFTGCTAGGATSCTMNLTGGLSPSLIVDFTQLPTSFVDERSGSYELRAVFPAFGVTKAAGVTVDERGLDTKDAQADVGPGSVNLVTGNFSYSADDVSFATPGAPLTISRAYNSRDADGKATSTDIASAGGGPLGPGWVLGFPADDAAADYTLLRELPDDPVTGERVELLTSDGTTISFWKQNNDYDPEDGYESYALTKPAADKYELRDLDANTVVFTKTTGQFVPTEVKPPAAAETPAFKYLYTYETGLNGRPRVKQIIAPREAGVTCTPGQTQPGDGCRALNLTYATSTTATGSTLGDYAGRLKSVSTVSSVPNAVPSNQQVEAVASYSYDSSGRLREAWDPRLPGLKEAYTYDASSRLSTITPPGESAWTLNYAQLGSGGGLFTPDTDSGRLRNVTRSAPKIGGTTSLVTSVVYRVPLTTAAGGPYAMGKTDIAAWGQSDYPIDATAIYPPGQPATDPLNEATVHYLGRRGMEVNTAAPTTTPATGKISVNEYDAKGNVIRSLTPVNRLAVAAGAPNAAALDTENTYSPDGLRLLDEKGPAHEIRTAAGALITAREHVVTTYDEGAPVYKFGEPAPNLATTVVKSASPVSGGADVDARTVKTKYDWKLRQPTATIIDPAGLNLETTTVYDQTTGRVIETRAPAAPDHDPAHPAATAHSTKTIYYSYNSSDPACVSRARAGMPCKTMPAAQPGTAELPDLPVTQYDYNFRLQPTTVTEMVGADAVRTTSTHYDSAGREDSEQIAAYPSTPDLVAAYGFNEGAGTTAHDDSGHSNDGTITGATFVNSQNTDHGKALSFTGASNSKVTIPDSQSLRVGDTFTFEAWLKPTTLPSNTNLSFWGSGPGGPNGYLWNGNTALSKDSSGEIAKSTASLTAGQWSHVALTKNGSTTKLYIDGQDVTGTVTNYTMAVVTSGMTLASNGTAANKWFNGLMDDVRIYNRALGQSEIWADRDTVVGAAPQDLQSSTAYSPTTGRPTTITGITAGDGIKTVTATFDSAGRPSTYTDAAGNQSSLGYDDRGRLKTVNDGKGTQTRTYNDTTYHLTSLADTQAGMFSATYNADDALVDQTYPGGIKATTTYDETGTAVELNYNKTTNCSSNCLWLRDKVRKSIHGQILWRDSNLSHQDYTYDQAGRLTKTLDTVAGQCSTRLYGPFDANSNRTSMTKRNPVSGTGACAGSGGTVTNSTYDAADRLTSSGVVYDTLGRIATVPATHSGGGVLSNTYYANDMVRSTTQDNVTKGWLLDPTLTRHRASMPNGNAQEILHYSDDSDSPAWSEQKQGATVDSWSRNIEGIDGSLAATYDYQTGTGTVTLQLPNLHGDIVATASNSSTATGLTATFESDEFGNSRTPSNRGYGWLGAKQRRTQLASGVIQMGVRSYVPAMGRFTSTDPVSGGSASDYDYAGADPVNNLDLDGRRCTKALRPGKRKYGPGGIYQDDDTRWAVGRAKSECGRDVYVKVSLETYFKYNGHWIWSQVRGTITSTVGASGVIESFPAQMSCGKSGPGQWMRSRVDVVDKHEHTISSYVGRRYRFKGCTVDHRQSGGTPN